MLLVAGGLGAYFAARGGNPERSYSPPGAGHPFFSGQMDGTSWKLAARDSGDGRYGIEVFTGGSLRATISGRFYVPGPTGAPVRLGLVSRSRGARPSFVAGAVVSTATHVAIRLSNGNVRYVRTMPPTRFLAPGISFFFTTVPHGVAPTSIGAREDSGRLVVSWHRP